MLSIILATYIISIVYNIILFRQVLGFLILVVLPGWLVLRISADRLDFWEKVILSVGLSVAYLMFMGLSINWIYFYLGIKSPLSLVFLLPTSTAGIVILAVIAGWRTHTPADPGLSGIEILFREPMLLIALMIPLFAVFGTCLMNTSSDNRILLGVYAGIIIYISFLALTPERESWVYPTASWAIGLALLLMYSLRSEHILGYDVHGEYIMFQNILMTSHWDITASSNPLNSCLSVVILPPVIQLLINISSGEYVYKIVYVLIFSVAPPASFYISRKYIGDRLAFLASMFFISQATFASSSQSNPRTTIALVFFALFIYVLFNSSLNSVSRITFLITFMAALVVSHYGTAYVFFAILMGGFIAGYLEKNHPAFRPYLISGKQVLFSGIFIFIWYAQISDVSFTKGVLVVKDVLFGMGNFFIAETRHQGTLKVMGIGARSSGDFLFSISHYLIALIIALGIIWLLYARIKGIRSGVLLSELEIQHLGMLVMSAAILMAMILMPYLSQDYTADRLWTQVMVLLSLPFVIGLSSVLRNRRNALNLLLLAVILFHFSNANYLPYQMIGEPRSLVLNSAGPDYGHFFVHDTEIESSRWLSDRKEQGAKVYSDFDGGQHLSLGHVEANWSSITFFLYEPHIKKIDYIYLGYSNVVLDRVFTGYEYLSRELLSDLFVDKAKIYDNGDSQIYKQQ